MRRLFPTMLALLILSAFASHVQSLPGTALALGTNAPTEVQEKAMRKPVQSADSMSRFLGEV